MNPELIKSFDAIVTAGSLSAMLSQPWAICVPALAGEFMAGRFKLRTSPPAAAMSDETRSLHPNDLRVYEEAGIAVQPVNGVMYPGVGAFDEWYYGEFNTDRIAESAAAVAANPGIHTMVFSFNTPGGSVYGLDPATKAILEMQRRRKGMNCLAWTSHLCASAGMYVAAACGQIHAAPSAIVGSIGTIASLNDWTGFKEKIGLETHIYTDGSKLKSLGYSPVTPAHDAHMKQLTALYSGEFKSWMKKRRGLKSEDMQGQYGEARHAPAGMVDSAIFPNMESMLAAGLGL